MEITKEELKQLLTENTLSVLFKKADGTQRAMLCTLNPDYLPVIEKKEGDEVKKTKTPSDTNIAVWDLEKNSWRSFRIDSIINYSIINQ
jgi:hypothetical protein